MAIIFYTNKLQVVNNMDQTLSHLLTKQKLQQIQIEANPWDVIPIKNAKEAKQTTEIHLGGKKATVLVNFNHFLNLQILWLNNNSLTSLKGLQKNFRIKHLFLQQNKIKTIDGIFDVLKYIETLCLYENQLRDLQRILKNIKGLTSLKHFDLFSNPAAYEPNYKIRVLNQIRSLEIHDRHKISVVEKEDAIKFMNSSKGKKAVKPFV